LPKLKKKKITNDYVMYIRVNVVRSVQGLQLTFSDERKRDV